MNAGTVSASARTGPGRLILVLGGLCAISPFATDMYAPAFPEIVSSLATSKTAVQLSLTAALLGLAAGQLVLGAVSDALGRRRLLLAGSALFTVFSVVCTAAPDILVFDIARPLQGIATYSDTCSSWGSGSVVCSPGVRLMALVRRERKSAWMRRKADDDSAAALRGRRTTPRIAALAPRSRTWSYQACSDISGSPFVFQGGYGLSPGGYSLVFATNAVGTVLSGVLFGRLAGRVRINALLGAGVLITAVAMGTLLLLLATGIDSFGGTRACLFGLTFGFGIVLPASTAIILAVGSTAPGAASGLLGGAQFVLSAVAAPLPGAFGNTTVLSTAVVVLGFVLLSVVALLVLARPWQGHGEPVGA